MTKKDYEKIARVLRNTLKIAVVPNSVVLTIERIAAMFKRDNPKFNKNRFLDICYKDVWP